MKHLMFIVLSCMLFSCKKTNDNEQISPGMSTADGKDWFARNMNSATNDQKRTGAEIQVLNPRWDRAVRSEDADAYITEVPVNFSTHHSMALATAGRAALPDPGRNATRFFLIKNKRSGLVSPVVMNVFGDGKINASDFHYAQTGSNFSGKVFYTTLNGDFIKGTAYTNGKPSGTISVLNKSQPAAPTNCENIDIGIYSQTCYYYTDGTSECGDEILLYVISYQVCSGNGGGDGTAPPPPPPPPADCQSAVTLVNSMTDSEEYPNSSQWGAQHTNPLTQEITRAKSCAGTIFVFHLAWYVVKWETFYTGVVYKTGPSDPEWKWKTFAYDSFVRTGSPPPYITSTGSATISTTIANPTEADGIGFAHIAFNIDCFSGTEFKVYNKDVEDRFYSGN